MSNPQDFLPRSQLELLNYGTMVSGVFKSGEYSPDVFGLADADVAEVDAAVSQHASLVAQNAVLRAALKANTQALSGRNGSTARLSAALRRCAGLARVSKAPTDALARINVKRKKVRGTPRYAPSAAPGFAASHAANERVRISFFEIGSASPRARAAYTTGIHIAVVDAANPVTAGEADKVATTPVTSSPSLVDTTGWPEHVRLYARWTTPTGECSPWSLFVPLTVR